MTTGSVMELNINDKAHSYAKIYASLLKDEYQRKRAYASLVALYALIDALEKTDNNVQKAMTLFRNPVLNEQYEISDLYINNWHIDVRVMTDGDAVLVPKSHYDNDIIPDFYAVVKVDKTLEKAELLGFADTLKTEKQAFDYHYCSIPLSSLISYDEFLAKVRNPKLVDFAPQEHENFRELYLGFMDEEMRPEIKNKLLKHLFECVQCRTEFCCFTGFEMVNCNMGSYPNLFDDMTLNIVGAQDVDNEKYIGQEQTIYIGDDDNPQMQDESFTSNSVEAQVENNLPSPSLAEEPVGLDEKEMTVSDILDELFGVEESYITPDAPKEKEVEKSEGLESDEFEAAVNEKVKELEGKPAFEEDEPLDDYVEVPLDASEVVISETVEPTIETLNATEEVNAIVEEPQLIEDEATAETILADISSEPSIELETENVLNISEDMQVIEENSVEAYISETEEIPLEVVDSVNEETSEEELEIIETNEELQVLDETIEEEVLSSVDIDDLDADNVELLSSSVEEDIEPTLEIHQDADEDLEILQEAENVINNVTSEAHEDIQKVIVDYDEFGEPVYSYITNVTQEAQLITDDALDDTDDDILNEQFETYPQENEDNLNYEINENSARPVEYVQNSDVPEFEEWKDDSATDINLAEKELDEELAEFEEYSDETDDEEQTSEFEEYKDEDVNLAEKELDDELAQFEDYPDDEATTAASMEDEFEEYQDTEPQVSVQSAMTTQQDNESIDEIEYKDVDEEEAVEEYNDNEDVEDDAVEDDASDEEYDDEEYEDEEEDDEEDMPQKKKGSPLVLLFVFLLLAVAGGAGAFFFLKNKNQEETVNVLPETTNNIEAPATIPNEAEQVTDMFGSTEDNSALEIPASSAVLPNDVATLPPPPETTDSSKGTIQVPELTEKDLIKPQRTIDRNKSIANAFTNGGNRATLRSVNWLCAPQLFTDSVFKAFMQDLDNILKLNLRKNILDATEVPQNNTVMVKMAIDKAGNLNKVLISESSGSQQIDNIVLQSINETFEGEKTQNLNDSALNQDMYYLKVVIKL